MTVEMDGWTDRWMESITRITFRDNTVGKDNFQEHKQNVITNERNGGNGSWMKDIRLDLHGSKVNMNSGIWRLQRDVLRQQFIKTQIFCFSTADNYNRDQLIKLISKKLYNIITTQPMCSCNNIRE